jgi:hypothetical protein
MQPRPTLLIRLHQKHVVFLPVGDSVLGIIEDEGVDAFRLA